MNQIDTSNIPQATRFCRSMLHQRKAWALAVSVIACAAAGSFISDSIAKPGETPATVASVPDEPQNPQRLAATVPSFATLVETVSPAVVTIEVDRQEQMQLSAFPGALDDFSFRGLTEPRRNGRGNPSPRPVLRSRAAGSGFIIDADGYIVTNNHVIDSARKITVHLADKREYEAKLIGTDPDTDVALLKVAAKNLPTVAFGDDRRLRVGDWVVAVGNPFGLGGTVTAGIVSSIGRDIGNGPYTDYIQIDAPINQGNSGGPTFDVSGRVIGMNTAIFSPSGGSVGIGFAIPASSIRAVVEQLKTTGGVERGWLGVEIQNFTPEIASSLGVHDAKGALVAGVTSDSPASRAGFRQGDVIVQLNGTNIEDSRDLSRDVARLRAGERASFTVLRDGAKHTLSAVIEKRGTGRLASDEMEFGTDSSLGLTLMPINPAIRRQYELGDKVTGVAVTAIDPESEAAGKGLQPGDVIRRVNGRPVRMPPDIARSVDEAKRRGRESILLLVASEDGEHFVALKLGKS